ncbi:YlxR family protein [Ornithinibacillus sp. 4-3]|uniref:YlxR family protein n=1 Tax=Ornithinibacillus sp. 4-3 TaxID=3231488 RepID=A0AB39HW33_9BACI
MVRKRKVPLRKCIVSNEMKTKEEMIRIVRSKEGEISVDLSGKKNGRGAYLSRDLAVIDKAEKTGILNKQFATNVDASIFEELREIIQGNENEK